MWLKYMRLLVTTLCVEFHYEIRSKQHTSWVKRHYDTSTITLSLRAEVESSSNRKLIVVVLTEAISAHSKGTFDRMLHCDTVRMEVNMV